MQTPTPIWSLKTWNRKAHIIEHRNKRLREIAAGSEITIALMLLSVLTVKNRAEKKSSFTSSVSLWHSERYLPCKDLDILLCALITSWNMNRSTESREEACSAFVNRYWLILGRKELGHGTAWEPLFADHLLTLSKKNKSHPPPRSGWEHCWWSSQLLWFSYQSENPALSMIHVSDRDVRRLSQYLDAALVTLLLWDRNN